MPPNLEKNAKTREKRKRTAQEEVSGRTFELKLDRKISRERLDLLLRLFLEAKWFTNYFIANGIANLSHRDYKLKTVPVKVVDTF
jgi:hypothetical protein